MRTSMGDLFVCLDPATSRQDVGKRLGKALFTYNENRILNSFQLLPLSPEAQHGPTMEQVRCRQVWATFLCVWMPQQVDRTSANGWARRFLLIMKTAFPTASGCCCCPQRPNLGPRWSRSSADKYGKAFCVFGSRNKWICQQKTVRQGAFYL